MSIHKKALFYGYNRCFVHGFDCLVDKQLSRIPSVHRYVSLVDKQGKARVRNKEADPKGQLLFFFGGGEGTFRRITTEN